MTEYAGKPFTMKADDRSSAVNTHKDYIIKRQHI